MNFVVCSHSKVRKQPQIFCWKKLDVDVHVDDAIFLPTPKYGLILKTSTSYLKNPFWRIPRFTSGCFSSASSRSLAAGSKTAFFLSASQKVSWFEKFRCWVSMVEWCCCLELGMAASATSREDEEVPKSGSLASRFRFSRHRSPTAGNERYSKLKNKALSAWNNLRNGAILSLKLTPVAPEEQESKLFFWHLCVWSPGWVIPTHLTVFGHDDPIWVLGVFYHGRNSGERIRKW